MSRRMMSSWIPAEIAERDSDRPERGRLYRDEMDLSRDEAIRLSELPVRKLDPAVSWPFPISKEEA